MARALEKDRRKDYCNSCARFMPIKAKDMCQNCWHKIKRKYHPEFYLRTRYTEIVQRCTNPNNKRADIYNGKKVCSREEFLNNFLNCPIFLALFENWKNNDFSVKFSPSVDRIDVKKDYTLDNIQMITHSENATKDQEATPINVFMDNKFFAEYVSQGEASRVLNVPQANIWKVLVKQRKTAGGYYFEYKKS